MASSVMLRRVAFVRTDVSEELHQGDKNRRTRNNASCNLLLRNVRRLLVTASVAPSSSILVTLIRR
jgi:hypothetical protein